MSEHQPKPQKVRPPRSFGWTAEYDDEHQLLEAARRVREAGYTKIDAFTPFPVHGIDTALGIRRTKLPWFSLIAGMTGTTVALLLQIWTNAIDYPYIISGKPYISLPAFIPVTFELTVLFAAFMTVFAMLGLNGLPKFSNPVFTNPKFDRASDDRFFLWVDSRDQYFNADKVRELLEATGALAVEEVREDDSPTQVPKAIYAAIAALILITLIPGAIVLNMRNSKSPYPRWHVFFDMDFQPIRKAQQPTTIFADGRVQRPPVPGTVARGELGPSDPFVLGYDPDAVAANLPAQGPSSRLVSYQQDGDEQPPAPVEPGAREQPPAPEEPPAPTPAAPDQPASSEPEAPPQQPAAATASQERPVSAEESSDGAAEQTSATAVAATDDDAVGDEEAPGAVATGDAGGEPNYAWLQTFPLEVTAELIQQGRREFEQNCAVCHGLAGYGDGLVARRAAELAQGYWLPPTSLHEQRIVEQPVGRLYYTITHGKGKMAPYADALTPTERWAIVAYIRVLQRSQNARSEDVPPGVDVAASANSDNVR
ncbi:MAG: hypothetical protein KatS3mg111_2985 [Pirellulaceae bacterium]|nr:MAG: hypothetical protein KatS3mg111_2985 [Pirellulaceae bacterium]